MSATLQDIRPARTTPRLGLPVPGDDGPADAPTDIGALADAVDLLFAPGDLKMSAALEDAPGWLLCDGRAISRAAFPALFARIGTAYGAGDGSTTFNIPPLSRRFPVGAGGSIAAGTTGGEEAHALALAEIPAHQHGGQTGVDAPDHTHAGQTGGASVRHNHNTTGTFSSACTVGPAGFLSVSGTVTTGVDNQDHSHAFGTGGRSSVHYHGITPEGGNGAHNNMPPYVGVNFFVKT